LRATSEFNIEVFLMKYLTALAVLVIGLSLVGFGSSNSNSASSINGTWSASLVDSTQAPIFTFGTSLQVNGDNSLSISNLTFTSNSPCFVSGETASGTFTFGGNFNGKVSGSFGFTVQSGSPSGNTVTLTGTAAGNTITGTWSLAGTGCSGTGTFTMTKA
jgi:hypothetical protein